MHHTSLAAVHSANGALEGGLRRGDGKCCEPLTLTDAHSRYLLRCQAMGRTDTAHVWPVLEAAFYEFGLPYRLRSDNGPPFASRGAGGLSQLSVKVIKAGLAPLPIAVIAFGKPKRGGCGLADCAARCRQDPQSQQQT